ncbi:MAG: YitT family protein, partial [Anaerolineae bacterium]|nr:YitT family protein [Anaerolineae bacterium]
MITIGAVIVAANVPLFLVPNDVISTGITGIGMLAHYLWRWPIGLVTLLINIPLILAGIRWGGGWRFFTRTIYAVLVLTIGIDVLSKFLPPIQTEPLLYTLFGGLLDGIGIG